MTGSSLRLSSESADVMVFLTVRVLMPRVSAACEWVRPSSRIRRNTCRRRGDSPGPPPGAGPSPTSSPPRWSPWGGEGAALGAAIHAAWVWLREEGIEAPLDELSSTFVTLEEESRRHPEADARQSHDLLVRPFRALTWRMRRLEGEDPFALRQALLSAAPRNEPLNRSV